MPETFTAQVSKWAKQSEKRMMAIAKTATQSVVEEVIVGTPVDTGFLRASFTVTTGNTVPLMTDSRPPSDAGTGTFAPQAYALTINGLKMGQVLTAGFVADYAIFVEMGGNGRSPVRMVGRAVQKWPQAVKDATRQAKISIR